MVEEVTSGLGRGTLGELWELFTAVSRVRIGPGHRAVAHTHSLSEYTS